MPARGSFSPKRKAFLESKRAEFATAVESGYAADGLSIIIRQYFKRFPIDLDDDDEPSDEALEAVDDNAPEPEVLEPSDDLGPEEHAAAVKSASERQARIQAKRGQITRWFTYRYMKDNNVDPRSDDPKNPYNALLLQITGNLSTSKPRRKAPVNVWVRDESSTAPIKAEIEKLLNGQKVENSKMVAIRSEAARKVFARLEEEEKEVWKCRAKEQHKEAMDEYERICRGQISSKPEDLQKCISGLVRFFQPVLDKVALATGFKLMLLAGGPEPEQGGRLNVVSMYSGTNGGDVPLNFGQAERAGFKKFILPLFGKYLRSCYTPEECRRRALVSSSAENSLQSVAMDEEGTFFHSFGIPGSATTSPPTDALDLIGDPTADVPELPTKPRSSSTNHLVADAATGTPPPPDTAHGGIAGITEAIRNLERSIAESVARSVSRSVTPPGSPDQAASLIPSPIPSPVARPRCLGSASTKRTRTPSPISTSKRPRTSSSNPPSCVAPPDAPNWVSNAVDMFVGEPLEGRWTELVSAWLIYEGRCNFAEGKRLSPKGRPQVIAQWIKWARKPTWRPTSLPTPENLGHEHTTWWRLLQPDWRVSDDGHFSRRSEGDWDCLRVCGVNGLLSALASIFFWGLAIRAAEGNTDSWDMVVEDTLFVIQQLTIDL